MSVTFPPKYEDAHFSPERRETATAPACCVKGSAPELVIALLNNMPDAALEATERQFHALLSAASAGFVVRLMRCFVPSIPRGEAAETYLRLNYLPVDALLGTAIDGLIVTGREPLTSDLREEPYWEKFVQVLEWAREKTASTIWSCLAAHAAVLHMSGIQRVRSQQKYCGVFDCLRASDHPLLDRIPERFRIPHSRWNGLPQEQLAGAGYELLSLAGDAGVDCFLRREAGKSLFLFFQGHPEYQPDTLLLEFRRDVLRHLRGQSADWPCTPRGLLQESDEATLLEIRSEAHTVSEQETLARLSELFAAARPQNGWHQAATSMYRNWLSYLSAEKARSCRQEDTGPFASLSAGAARGGRLEGGSFA